MQFATRDTIAGIVSSAPVAAIHFDADWDQYRTIARDKMREAQEVLGSRAAFAEVDVDVEGELAKAVGVLNVPCIAYYVRGQLIAVKVHASQDVCARLEQLLHDESLTQNGIWSRLSTIVSRRSPDMP